MKKWMEEDALFSLMNMLPRLNFPPIPCLRLKDFSFPFSTGNCVQIFHQGVFWFGRISSIQTMDTGIVVSFLVFKCIGIDRKSKLFVLDRGVSKPLQIVFEKGKVSRNKCSNH